MRPSPGGPAVPGSVRATAWAPQLAGEHGTQSLEPPSFSVWMGAHLVSGVGCRMLCRAAWGPYRSGGDRERWPLTTAAACAPEAGMEAPCGHGAGCPSPLAGAAPGQPGPLSGLSLYDPDGIAE